MESHDDNNKALFECFYRWSLSLSDMYLSSPFPKHSQTLCYILSGRLIGARTIENLHGDEHRLAAPRPRNRRWFVYSVLLTTISGL